MKCNYCGEAMDFKNDFNLIGNQFNIEQKSDRFIFAIICNTIDESLQERQTNERFYKRRIGHTIEQSRVRT